MAVSANHTFNLVGHVSRNLVDELSSEHGYDGSVTYEYSPQVGTTITLTSSENGIDVDDSFRKILDRVGAEFRI